MLECRLDFGGEMVFLENFIIMLVNDFTVLLSMSKA